MDGLSIMGVANPDRKPSCYSIPSSLSKDAKQIWKEICENEFNVNLINSLGLNESWELVWRLVINEALSRNKLVFDPKLTGMVALNDLKLDVTGKRAMLVTFVDRTGALKNCKVSNIERVVTWQDGYLKLRARADVNIFDMDPYEWFEQLTRKRGYRPYGREYRLFGAIPGVEVGFEITMPNIQYYSEISVKTNFIPDKTVEPIVDTEAYSRFMLNKVWLPAVRKFRFKSLKRKTILL